jgi:regulator of sirC expression with transglutaminase-like and TPR domain
MADTTGSGDSVGAVDATARFVELMRKPEHRLPLDEAALLVASHALGHLDIEAELARLDALAARCERGSLDRLAEVLFVEEGFTGDRDTYEDPRNSFLPRVLDRRRGIPITLSVVAMEVARRVDVDLAGIGMPGHFLVGSPADEIYLDPFDGGRRLTADGCRARFHAVVGPGTPWDDAYLAPVGGRAIVARMLANLRQRYLADADATSLIWVLQLRRAIPGIAAGESEEAARILAGAGRFGEAAAVLEAVGSDSPAVALRARLN